MVLVAEWLADMHSSLDARTIDSYLLYGRTHWDAFFHNNFAEITDRGLAEYARYRLSLVTRRTVQKELSAMNGFLTWCVERDHLDEVPQKPKLPKLATGVRSGPQREKAVELSPAQVRSILDALPERGGKGDNTFPVRDYFVVAYETGLRPATLRGLEVPKHYRKGARELVIDDTIDKNRFGRTLPLTAESRAALDRCAPVSGPIFGKHDYRERWQAAVSAAKAPAGASPYDLRHARATHLLDAGASLSGTAYLLGHRQLTTTDRYAKANRRAAEEALKKAAVTLPVPEKGDANA